MGSGGVWGAARVEGGAWSTRVEKGQQFLAVFLQADGRLGWCRLELSGLGSLPSIWRSKIRKVALFCWAPSWQAEFCWAFEYFDQTAGKGFGCSGVRSLPRWRL